MFYYKGENMSKNRNRCDEPNCIDANARISIIIVAIILLIVGSVMVWSSIIDPLTLGKDISSITLLIGGILILVGITLIVFYLQYLRLY